jgi:hypothetical protein
MNEDIRQQVILALGVEGQENADLILQAIYKVKEEQEKLVASLGQQGVETQKVVAEITKLAGVLGSLSTIYNGLTGATQYLKDAEAAEAQAAREAAEAEKLLAEQLKNDSTNARKVAAQAAKDEAQILRTEMAEAAREAAAAEKLLAEQLRNESVNARRVAAQAARDEADVIKNQLIVAEMQNAATNQLLAESEKALAAATRGDGVAAKKQSAQASKEAAGLNKLLEESTVALARADSKLSDTRDKGRGSADASTQTMLHWTRTVYFASQAVDDLQYGFRSIVNNLPLIGMSVSQALGGTSVVGMQVGAAVGIASVAINQLIPVVQHFVDQRPALQAFSRTFVETLNPFHVDQMKTSLESLNERIKELQGKKVRLAIEDFELDVSIRKAKELQKALEAAEEARTGRSKAERESGRAVEEILAEAPGGEPALFGRLAGQMAARDFAQHPEMRAIEAEEQKARNRVEYAKRQGTYDDLVEQRFQQRMETLAEDRRKLRETVTKGAEAAMGDVFRRAKLGDIGAQQQLIGLTGAIGPAAILGGPVGMPSLAAQIAGVSPAETRARLEHEEEIPALTDEAQRRKRAREETERIAEGARQKVVQDRDKAEAETERIAEGARQKAVQDADKAERERQRKAEQRTREVAGAFDQSVQTSLAAMFQQNRAQREVVARMRPAERRQFLRQRQLEQRELKRQRAAEARGENLARRMMAPAERAAFDRQRQLRDRQRALFEAPAAPLGEDAMQALIRRRLAGQLVGAHDARGAVIDQATAGAAADAILNKLIEKINAAQLGAVAGVPPAGGRAGAIDQMFGGGMIDVMPPRMPPMGRGRGGFRSVAPAPPQAGADITIGALGGQLATNQAGLVQSQAQVANTAMQAYAYARAVGREVEEMMRWHVRMQPQRGHFWPGFYGGF